MNGSLDLADGQQRIDRPSDVVSGNDLLDVAGFLVGDDDLAQRVKAAGGTAWDFTYRANTHSLLLSEHDWFSGPFAIEGFDLMIARDVQFMLGGDPANTTGPDSLTPGDNSVIPGHETLRDLAETYPGDFEIDHVREPIDGLPRRVVRFEVDGLTQYALIIEPEGNPPPEVFVQARLAGFERKLRAQATLHEAHCIHVPYWHITGKIVQGILGRQGDVKLAKGKGCEECYDSGYKGRLGIHEILITDPDLQKLIISSPSRDELSAYLGKRDFHNLFQDGLGRALERVTTIEEVSRVTSI